MNHKIYRSNKASSFWLKLCVACVLIFLTCQGPLVYVYAPLEGRVMDSSGIGLFDIHVYSIGVSGHSPRILLADSLYDSCYSEENGDFVMANGFPWHYPEALFGCDKDPVMDLAGMSQFGLMLIDSDSDTTLIFCIDTCYTWEEELIDSSRIDIFLDFSSCTEENQLGETIRLPNIIL